jgi:hypothetical protein
MRNHTRGHLHGEFTAKQMDLVTEIAQPFSR